MLLLDQLDEQPPANEFRERVAWVLAREASIVPDYHGPLNAFTEDDDWIEVAEACEVRRTRIALSEALANKAGQLATG
jgi:hypothetical protein